MVRLSLASWSLFVGTPFGKSPQLAAIASTFFAILLAIIALILKSRTGVATILTLIFPPMFYVFAIRSICGWEHNVQGANALKGDPTGHVVLLPLIIVALVSDRMFGFLTCDS